VVEGEVAVVGREGGREGEGVAVVAVERGGRRGV